MPLILATITLDYVVGRRLAECGTASRKPILGIGIFIHLALLGWFKYAGFASGSLNSIGLPIPVLEVVLPVGISFYSF